MMAYLELVDFAYSLLLDVHKSYLDGNSMAYPMIIVGMGNLKVESNPDAGHNYYAVSDAIHRLYEKDTRCKDGLEAGLIKLSSKVFDMTTFNIVYTCISYERYKIENKTNKFVIQLKLIISSLLKTFEDNDCYNTIIKEVPYYKETLDKCIKNLKEWKDKYE